MSDCLSIEMTGEGRERLLKGLELCPMGRATGMAQRGNTLVIHYDLKSQSGNLYAVKPEVFADGIMEWLSRTQNTANKHYLAPDYGPEPDIDGSVHKGWKLLSASYPSEIVISPHWMTYHK